MQNKLMQWNDSEVESCLLCYYPLIVRPHVLFYRYIHCFHCRVDHEDGPLDYAENLLDLRESASSITFVLSHSPQLLITKQRNS